MDVIDQTIERLRTWIERRGLDPEIVRSAVRSQFERTKNLQNCSQASLEAAIAKAVFLRLDLSLGADHAYLAPRKSQVTLLPGYRGLTALAYHHPRVSALESHVVYSCDEWECRVGGDPVIIHRPTLVGAYAILWWNDSPRPLVEWMTVPEINANAKRGSGGDANSAWATDWDQMARKTVLKRLLGRLPLADAHAIPPAETTPDRSQIRTRRRPRTQLHANESAGGAKSSANTAEKYSQLIQRAGKTDIPSLGAAIRSDDSIDIAHKKQLFHALTLRSRELR